MLGVPLWGRAVVGLLVVVAAAVVWVTNGWLTDSFTDATRNRAELRLVLYSGNIQSELQRNTVVPLLLARDPDLIAALREDNYATTSQRLIQVQTEIGAAAIELLDRNGRTVAATDRNNLGGVHATDQNFVDARRANDTIFSVRERDSGGYGFEFARAVRANGEVLGVVLVQVDLAKFERSWAGFADAVALLDSEGTIVLATEPRWRGRSMEEALSVRDAPSAIARALRATADWSQTPPDAFVRGEAVLRSEARVPFRGWRLISFTRYDSVREQVNGVLALVIMGFALLLTLTFYLVSRRAWSQSALFQRESAELRALNARLQREIAAREKVQQDLAVAEQTLEQSSKLASLGEMSASVSHELNQPLAAMKTYLAGARLLLKRRRVDEALAAFKRVDDLIDRMAAIARQLKSYARKAGEAFAPVDFRDCVAAALAMMEPQLKANRVLVSRTLPRTPVMVMADRLRLEQVIINLIRNAIDATQGVNAPQLDILISQGDTVTLTVRDNGTGITDLDKMFEPFFTTKKPGEGVGLGLAISSGIVSDHGGRLTAQNASAGGAVFEVQLPILTPVKAAAE
ncbi:sensor histidine kinase [Roseicitreum antarcticum]|uniref:C4-dicarboxylate transport sensor protein DctB n=1 Tax=Roseicitreum antarcticum TaxID=564137 RepID=A0A1H2ZP71_9RHOB|nr:ATP-binding protein [Roseicitreum antarcticum]SDX19342.1 two-component system, NtrC family, C4-dicarboxylate transport sensor histidine kinase DctB [Roseicitreum antarcticum]